jgi:hypothetical protein
MDWKRVRPIILMGLGVALAALPVTGAPPALTGVCTFSGDIFGDVPPDYVEPVEGGPVEIGVSVTAWELLVPGTDQKTTLWLSQNLLNDDDGQPYLFEGVFYGQARVLKKDGRFDFDFDTAPCESPTYGDGNEPPFGDDDDFCRYRLIVQDGIYDRKADTVVWEAGSRVQLDDYSSGPYIAASWSADGYLFTAEFGTGGGEDPDPEPEPDRERSADLCSDGVDNDGDGLADCSDRDCKRWCK